MSEFLYNDYYIDLREEPDSLVYIVGILGPIKVTQRIWPSDKTLDFEMYRISFPKIPFAKSWLPSSNEIDLSKYRKATQEEVDRL